MDAEMLYYEATDVEDFRVIFTGEHRQEYNEETHIAEDKVASVRMQ